MNINHKKARRLRYESCSVTDVSIGGRLRVTIRFHTELPFNSELDSVEDSLACLLCRVAGNGALLVDTSFDEDGEPMRVANLVETIRATNVRLGSISDEVDGAWRLVDAVGVLPPLAEKSHGEFICTELWLTEGNRVQFFSGHCVVHRLKRSAEGTHTEARVLVGSGPDNVIVGEEDGWAFIECLGTFLEVATLCHQAIKNDLLVTSPVTAVGKDEDGIDAKFLKIKILGIVEFLLGQFPERSGILFRLDEVAGSDNVLEAITLGNNSALLALATDDENSIIFLCHIPHRGVAADELARGDFKLKLTAEI